MIADLTKPQLTTLWEHLRARHETQAETAEAFLEEATTRNRADIIMACLDRSGGEWEAILSAILQRPLYKCAPGETAFPLTDMKGRTLPSPRGHRFGQPSAQPEPQPLPQPSPAVKPRAAKRDTRVVVFMVENPKTPGSKSFDRYALYRVGMTVDQFLEAGGRKQDIAYDIAKGFIKLGYNHIPGKSQ